jgi:hypothetical protein
MYIINILVYYDIIYSFFLEDINKKCVNTLKTIESGYIMVSI